MSDFDDIAAALSRSRVSEDRVQCGQCGRWIEFSMQEWRIGVPYVSCPDCNWSRGPRDGYPQYSERKKGYLFPKGDEEAPVSDRSGDLKHQPGLLKPALIAGVIFGTLSGIPVVGELANLACCAPGIGGGFLYAFLYSKKLPPGSGPPWAVAARMGALTGAIAAVVGSIVVLPFTLLGEGLIVNMSSPSQLSTGQSGVVWLMLSLVFFSIFSMVGSLIGVSLFVRARKSAAEAPEEHASEKASEPLTGPPRTDDLTHMAKIMITLNEHIGSQRETILVRLEGKLA